MPSSYPASVDLSGYATIAYVDELVAELQDQIDALDARVDALDARVDALETLASVLESPPIGAVLVGYPTGYSPDTTGFVPYGSGAPGDVFTWQTIVNPTPGGPTTINVPAWSPPAVVETNAYSPLVKDPVIASGASSTFTGSTTINLDDALDFPGGAASGWFRVTVRVNLKAPDGSARVVTVAPTFGGVAIGTSVVSATTSSTNETSVTSQLQGIVNSDGTFTLYNNLGTTGTNAVITTGTADLTDLDLELTYSQSVGGSFTTWSVITAVEWLVSRE